MSYNRWNPPPKHWKQFWTQRYNAKRRGIAFRLTYDEWLVIWQKSGHLPHRGKGSGRYCMARYSDKGAYAVGNVCIITHNQNSSDIVVTAARRAKISAQFKALPRTPKHRAKISRSLKGRLFSEETRQRMSAAAKKRSADPASKKRFVQRMKASPGRWGNR